MEQKILQRSRWKIPLVETFNYQFHFLIQFCKHNPEFVRELVDDLFPLHLDIFGKHEKTTPLLSEYNWLLTPGIAGKDYFWFFCAVETKLKVFNYEVTNQETFSSENLRIKTDILLDKIISVIERYNLFFGNANEYIDQWLIHWLLCQIEAGTPSLMSPIKQIVFELPFKMLEGLWRELPELEQTLIMKNTETKFKAQGLFRHHKHHFESLDVFMKTFPFKHLPPPMMFDFRHYNIYEDMENYEKMAVKAFKEHIKNYTRRITNAFNENGFKRNNTDDYSRTEWLVIWNKHKVEFLWEILPYIPDFQDVNANNEDESRKAENSLEKAFKKFEKFELPIRPFGRKRKNSKQKTGADSSGKK
jgi:hypothetical protein